MKSRETDPLCRAGSSPSSSKDEDDSKGSKEEAGSNGSKGTGKGGFSGSKGTSKGGSSGSKGKGGSKGSGGKGGSEGSGNGKPSESDAFADPRMPTNGFNSLLLSNLRRIQEFLEERIQWFLAFQERRRVRVLRSLRTRKRRKQGRVKIIWR
jgi:hypothetical protein